MEKTDAKTEDVVNLVVKVPASMARALDDEASKYGLVRGRSAMARMAISEHLQRVRGEKKHAQEAA